MPTSRPTPSHQPSAKPDAGLVADSSANCRGSTRHLESADTDPDSHASIDVFAGSLFSVSGRSSTSASWSRPRYSAPRRVPNERTAGEPSTSSSSRAPMPGRLAQSSTTAVEGSLSLKQGTHARADTRTHGSTTAAMRRQSDARRRAPRVHTGPEVGYAISCQNSASSSSMCSDSAYACAIHSIIARWARMVSR
jgi:hypothetical protein